jgi:hypothetical protein
MPAYSQIPGHRVIAVVAGFPTYLLGSWSIGIPTTKFLVQQVAITSNVATVTGAVVEGNIPLIAGATSPDGLTSVGASITIQGTTSNGGAFNVTNIAIGSGPVSITTSTGLGSISFPLTHANVATTNDGGLALLPQPENYETLTAEATIPFTIPIQDPKTDSARTLSFMLEFLTALPTAATIDLQTALLDQNSEYTKFQNLVTIAGTAISSGSLNPQLTLNQARFYRLNISGVTLGSNTGVIAKIQV